MDWGFEGPIDDLVAELKNRIIHIKQGPEIIRWGHRTKGTFTIKEAYSLKTSQHNDQPDPSRGHLWGTNHWPKVSSFLWLLYHRSILTWENLHKRGLMGPSIYVMCGSQVETIDHLLDSCPFAKGFWDKVFTNF